MTTLVTPEAEAFDPFAGGLVERVVATSEAQREVWLADRLGTEASLAFNESVTLRIAGALDGAALRSALAALVARHAMLRATVGPDGSELLVGPPALPALAEHDLRALAPAAREQALQDACVRAVETPFSLEHGPLLRCELLRLADDDAALVMTAHHIVCDGWSWGLIAEDLGALYTEALGLAPQPEPAHDYADYVAWERGAASAERRVAAERHWLSRFAGAALPVLDLPTDRPRPPRRSFASRRLDHLLPAADVQALQRTAAREGASLFAALLAAFAALLQRLGGQDDVVIGVPSAGQSTSGLTQLVGHCVNLLPVRLAPDPARPAAEFIAATGGAVLDAFEHGVLSYGELLAKLPLARDPSRLPLVSVMFNVDQAVAARIESFGDLAVTLAANPRHSENFELFVNAARLPDGGLRLECQYNTGLFDAATVACWMRCYARLVRSLAQGAEQPLGRLPLLDDADRARLAALQPARDPSATGGLMHAAFERQAADTPARPAVRCGDESLSYAQLDQRATRIALAVAARGVGRGDRVGLCLARGVDMLAALLGVLKAGAAYVPLDPAFPPARLAYYAEDAALALLITQSGLAQAPAAWRADAASRMLRLDDPSAWHAGTSALLPAPQPEDPAYVIYTSGSTGLPKGVVVPHRAVANFLAAMRQQPGLGADERLAAVTTLSFDIAVLELLLPLSVGAEVVIVPRDTVTDALALGALLAGSQASVMQATPGLWRMLLDTGWRPAPGFRALVGGEPLPPDLAHALTDLCAEVWNLYGPTETTVWSTAWRVDSALAGAISIGRPIRRTSVWVLDEAGQPCPVGVPGELCIGGDGVALGYLARPELTAERFIPDAFGGVPGARLYRTGDRGRWRQDGLLEHLGRLDLQVKVRGYRIELGEIEAAVSAQGGVAGCAALAREDVPGDVRLVAYVLPAPGAAVDEARLREALRARLPEYMVPQHVVRVDAWPRLPNGKLDRKALPAPLGGAPAAARIAPRTPLEAEVAALMSQVLKLSGLGVHDDFFALGGHSLLAARLMAQLNRAFDIALPLRTLFEAATVERLARAVDAARGQGGAAGGIVADPSRRWAPLTPMQERIRFMHELFPGNAVYNTPSAHRLAGPMDVAAFQRAFAAMVRRQPALRSSLQADGAGGHRVALVDAPVAPMPVVDLRADPGRLADEMQALAVQPFDLAHAPLYRAALYRTGEQEHVWVFVPHHLVWDGWSFDVMYEEMAALYAREVDSAALPEPPLPPLTFLDHAHWLHQWLAGDDAARELAWWQQRYQAIGPVAALPTEFARRAGRVGQGGSSAIVVDPATTARLRAAARQADVTLGMLALAIFAAFVARLTGQPQLVLGVPVRGREGGDLDRAMGYFNNLLALPLHAEATLTVAELARRTRRDLLDAMAHQQVPFERVSALPEVAAHGTASGPYQAAFSYQDVRERPPHWGPLVHQRVPLFQDGVTEELSVWLAELDDRLTGALQFDRELFSPATGDALRDHCLELLARAPDVMDRPLAALFDGLDSDAAGRVALLRAQAPRLAAPPQHARPAAEPLSGRAAELAALWAELLAIDPADVRAGDNFFDLGGDSMMAMRAVELTAARLGLRIEPRRYIFETLGQIASTEPAAPAPAEAAPPFAAKGRLGRLFSAFARGRTA